MKIGGGYMKERKEMIKRLKRCRDNNKEFYKRYPKLMKQLELKIKCIEQNKEYKVVSAGWIIPYVGAKMKDYQQIGINEGALCDTVGYSDYTVEDAKKVFNELIGE